MTDVTTHAALDDRELRAVLDGADRTRHSAGGCTFDAGPAEAYVVTGAESHAVENRDDDPALAADRSVPPPGAIRAVGGGSR